MSVKHACYIALTHAVLYSCLVEGSHVQAFQTLLNMLATIYVRTLNLIIYMYCLQYSIL